MSRLQWFYAAKQPFRDWSSRCAEKQVRERVSREFRRWAKKICLNIVLTGTHSHPPPSD
jgi:hypothetical protein